MSCTARTAAHREEVPPVKTKKASLLTKLVVLALLIGAATGLLNLRQQILTAQSDLAEAEAQVAAQKQVNACLLYTSPSPRDPKTYLMPSSA